MIDEKKEAEKLNSSNRVSNMPMPRGPGNRGNMGVIEKPKNFRQSMGYLLGFAKEYMGWFVFAIVLAVLSVIALVLGPNQLNLITTEIQKGVGGEMNMREVHRLCIILMSLYVGSCVLHVIQEIILSTVSQKVTKKLRSSIDKKINRLPLKYYDTTSFGDVLSRVTNDVDTIGQALHNSLAVLVRQSIFLLGSLVMMFVTNVVLAGSAVGSTVFGVAFIFIILKISQKHFRKQQRNLGALNGRIEEVYSGHNIVRLYNGSKTELKVFDEINERLYSSAWKSQFLSGLMQPVMGCVGNFGYVVICVVQWLCPARLAWVLSCPF